MYERLTEDPTRRLKKEIDEFLQEAYEDNIITVEEKQILTNDTPRVSFMYLVPKIHKDLKKPPGRPIVSGVQSIFYPLAVYIDSHLQDIVKKLPNCLKDTGDLLNRIQDIDVTDVTMLCTLDVQSLYTNIPLDEGCDAIRDKLSENAKLSNQQISFLMSLLHIVLTKNDLRFGQEFYYQ